MQKERRYQRKRGPEPDHQRLLLHMLNRSHRGRSRSASEEHMRADMSKERRNLEEFLRQEREEEIVDELTGTDEQDILFDDRSDVVLVPVYLQAMDPPEADGAYWVIAEDGRCLIVHIETVEESRRIRTLEDASLPVAQFLRNRLNNMPVTWIRIPDPATCLPLRFGDRVLFRVSSSLPEQEGLFLARDTYGRYRIANRNGTISVVSRCRRK